MKVKRLVTTLFLAVLFLIPATAPEVYAEPHVEFPPEDGVLASKKEVKELKTFYSMIESALSREDLEAMMVFYSDDYFHRGITKGQVRLMWKNIFEKFSNLRSIHVFSEMTVQDSEALVVCTGTLLGVPKGEEAKHVAVDRWINQNHFLSKSGGKWRIVGGASHWLSEMKMLPGGALEYQLEFHPLF